MVCDLLSIFQQLFFWLLWLSFAVAVLLAIFSGFSYILAIGNAPLLARSKRALRTTLLGFGLCLLSWAIINSVYIFLGYHGTWWKIDCQVSDESSGSNSWFGHEIAADNLGGRNNPIAISQLTQQKLDEIPTGQYFFVHGLNGQPLNDAAEQIASFAEDVKNQNKIVYAATPARDPASKEIIGSSLFNITNLVAKDRSVTVKNAKTWIVRVLSEGTSSEIPLIKGAAPSLPKFTAWPQKEISKDKAAATLRNGVLYQEDQVLTKEDDYGTGLDYSVNLVDGKLDRENPVSFTINRPDVSPTALKSAAADIADFVGESTKDSQRRSKDEYTQLSNLLTKDTSPVPVQPVTSPAPPVPPAPSEEIATYGTQFPNDYVFGTAPGPTQVATNPDQKISSAKIQKTEAELEQMVKDLIDSKLAQADKRFPQDLGWSSSAYPPQPATSGDKKFEGGTNTPQLDSLIAEEQEFVGGLNVARVENYDLSRLSRIGGKITTNNVLGLDERQAIYDMLLDIQKEMSETSATLGKRDPNVPVDLQMCLFYKETLHKTVNSKGKKEAESYDASAKSVSGCSGLGQLNMSGARIGVQYLKKYAPKHFQALAEKVKKEQNINMEWLLTCDPERDRRCKNENKRILLRRDPNLNAAVSFALLNEKARGGINGNNKPIANTQAGSPLLRSLAAKYGPGDTGPHADPNYADLVMWCYQNNAWRKVSEAGQLAANKRLNK